ncbi:hypothetical protein BJ138DRAFT_1149084 [Hygrophoropsis aurantiaca]|uniref:Uncharacterized protein n=1 Tax=Hygrophoropsis aurantiaca TaxID=72124 RepID=A0ACB8AFN9_9AGAM|nr:hypothetical protein BJ138DRAFT_1149084 [Hygrophoropsis aurantiaca]
MSANLIIAHWAPLFIGSIISYTMYGIVLAQYGFYLFSFPDDKMSLKALLLHRFRLCSFWTPCQHMAHCITNGKFS